MRKQKLLLPILALIVANMLWGLNTIFIKIGLETIPPSLFVASRFAIAGLCVLPFALKNWKPLSKRETLHFIIASVVTITLSSFTLNLGLSMAPALNAAIIWLLGPILLLVLSASFLQEKISLRAFIGILVAILGSFIIISGASQGSAGTTGTLAGNLLLVLSVLFQAIAVIISKPLMKKANTYQATFLFLFPGSIPLAIYAASTLHTSNLTKISHTSALAFIACTAIIIVANVLFYYGLNRKSAHTTGIYSYLDPAVTVVAAWFILSERPSTGFVMGAILILAGIYLSELHTKKKQHLLHKHKL